MARLPIEVAPHVEESAYGFMLRVLAANGAHPRELLALTRGSTRRQLAPGDAPLFSELTGIGERWFDDRIPREIRGDRWIEIDVFGNRWRSDWSMRGQYCQVCPRCLLESGYARLEWDLTAYVACVIHRELLVDRCGACGRALLPNRPAVDICSCGRFIDCPPTVRAEVSADILNWCDWLSRAVLAALADRLNPRTTPILSLQGLSVDGAYRMIVALGGGTRELHGALLHSESPWLGTDSVHDVLLSGLTALKQVDEGRKLAILNGRGCGDALAEQSVRGISAFDRHAAALMRTKLQLPARWRNVRRVVHVQGDLFEGWP